MKNKLCMIGISSAVLVFSLVFIGCPTEPEEDTWKDVTSLEELDGAWKGSYNMGTQSIKDFMDAMSPGTWNDTTAALFGNMTVTVTADMTMTINAANKTLTRESISTTIFSGGTIFAWEMIKQSIATAPQEPGTPVVTNDEDHSLTMTMVESLNPTSAEEIAETTKGVQINQNGNKIKILPDEAANIPEMFLTKQ